MTFESLFEILFHSPPAVALGQQQVVLHVIRALSLCVCRGFGFQIDVLFLIKGLLVHSVVFSISVRNCHALLVNVSRYRA